MVRVKPLKVTFFHPDLGIGGAERLVLDVAVALSDQGMEVGFVTNHFDKSHAFEELKAADRYPVTVIGDWLPRSLLGRFQAFCAYVRMMYLAIVYVVFFKYVDQSDVFVVDQIPMAVPFLKKFTNKKIIYYCHHPDLLGSDPGNFLKRLYRKPIDYLELKGTGMSDVILVNSKYTAEVFKRTFPEITKELTIVYPTISSSAQLNIKRAKKKSIRDLIPDVTDVDDDDTFFLSINRFHPAKKLELSIDALSVIKAQISPDKFKKIRLIVAGGYDPNSTTNKTYFDHLVKLSSNLNLNNNITFLKSPSDSLKAQLLVSCDCLIYTPINEHFGIVPLEAMAASRPVLACNSGGPRETVEHNITGYLCEPNGTDFAEAMIKVCDDAERAKEMGKNGLKRLEKSFGYDTFSNNVMQIVMSSVCLNRIDR